MFIDFYWIPVLFEGFEGPVPEGVELGRGCRNPGVRLLPLNPLQPFKSRMEMNDFH